MEYSSPSYELMCNECGKRYGNRPMSGCPDCLAPLEVVYDLLSAKGVFTRDSIARGPASIWRYACLLPVPEGVWMEYSCPSYELMCNECGKRYGNRPMS